MLVAEHIPGRSDGRPVVLLAVRPGAGGGRASPRGGLALVVDRPHRACWSRRSGLGATLAASWPMVVGGRPPVAPVSWEFARLIWTESLPILRDFPVVGTGLGSFGTIHPYVKTHDASSTTAMSSLLQCGVESGAIGLGILAAGRALVRLPLAGLSQASRPRRPDARLRLDRSGPGL